LEGERQQEEQAVDHEEERSAAKTGRDSKERLEVLGQEAPQMVRDNLSIFT